jgi:8-amino-7-oxononanoate synthase
MPPRVYKAPELLHKSEPMSSLDQFATAKLAALDDAKLRRTLVETARQDGLWIVRSGRRLLSFSCNDYLNLTHHPAVKAAAVAAIETHGAGAGASRLITGNHPLYGELETRLARLKGTDSACVFGSGYLANAGIIPTLLGGEDVILVDELAHSCLWAGAQLSRARVLTFAHNDVGHARDLLIGHRARYGRAMILTDGVFSMDGDLAPLAELAGLALEFDAWLMSDDAHGLGVLGDGKGTAQALNTRVELQMGTLSKALGSYGGYLCASRPVIDLIKSRARTLVYSTGLPPASVAAAIAALGIIATDSDLVARPLGNARYFTRTLDLPLAQSPVVPLVLGEPAAALEAQRILEEEGFQVSAIRPPTVPNATSRLRFAFTAGHPRDEIERLTQLVAERFMPLRAV